MLGPWSSVTGRVVDDDGEPRSDIAILLYHEPYPEHALGGSVRQPSMRFELDKDGRFRIDALAPGVKYNLNVFLRGIGIVGYVEKELMVQPGEVKDLGDRKVVDLPLRGEPMRESKPAAAPGDPWAGTSRATRSLGTCVASSTSTGGRVWPRPGMNSSETWRMGRT